MALGVLHFMFAAFTAQYTVIPEYVVHRGGSEWELGIVIGSYNIATMFLRPFMAKWVARVGPRRAGVVAGVIFTAAVLLYVPAANVWTMVPVRMLNGFGMSLGTLGAFTAVANLAPARRRGEGLAFQSIALSAGGLWAPYVGYFLLEEVSFTWAFVALAATGVAAGLCALGITSPLAMGVAHRERGDDKDVPFISKPALFPTFILLTHTFTFAPLVTFLPGFADERGLGNPGIFWTVYSIGSMAVMLISGPLADRLGRAPVIVPGLLLASAAMFAMTVAESPLVLIAIAAVYGAGFALLGPALQAFMFDRVPARERSAAVATISYAWEIGQSGGAFALGPIAGAWGIASTFAIVGAINVAGLDHLPLAHAALARKPPSPTRTS